MKYTLKKHWKYKLYEGEVFKLNYFFPDIEHEYFSISGGYLFVYRGYTWDGASGIPDTDKTLMMSLLHDPLYQAIREGLLPHDYKKYADLEAEYYYKSRSSFVTSWMGNFIYWGVALFGESSLSSYVLEVN